MAFDSYSSLKTVLAAHAARDDLTDYLADFITLAEAAANYGSDNTPALRVRDMETESTLTATSTGWTIPDDYLHYSHVKLGNCVLTYLAKGPFDALDSSGTPEYFTIVGDEIRVNGSTSGDLVLTYTQSIPALSDANTSNWLLSKHPNIYLRLALMELSLFIHDDSKVQKNATLASAYIEGANNAGEMAEYANASMSINGYAQ